MNADLKKLLRIVSILGTVATVLSWLDDEGWWSSRRS